MYNEQLSKLSGLVTGTAQQIINDPNLKQGEKYLLLQQFFQGIKTVTDSYEALQDFLKEWAKENLTDMGDNKSKQVFFEGAEISIKYKYPKPKLNAELLKQDLEKAFAEIGTELDITPYLIESTPTRTVEIQRPILTGSKL
jgi:hypothetical protein